MTCTVHVDCVSGRRGEHGTAKHLLGNPWRLRCICVYSNAVEMSAGCCCCCCCCLRGHLRCRRVVVVCGGVGGGGWGCRGVAARVRQLRLAARYILV